MDGTPGRSGTTKVRAASWIILAMGAAIFALALAGSSRASTSTLGGNLAIVLLGFLVAIPGVFGLMALHGRPGLLLSAGVLALPLSVLSMAGATLPLLVPAVMLLTAYGRARRPARQPRVGAGPLLLVELALVLAGARQLIFEREWVVWSSAQESYGSEVTTLWGAASAAALFGAALAAAWWLSAARRADVARPVLVDSSAEASPAT